MQAREFRTMGQRPGLPDRVIIRGQRPQAIVPDGAWQAAAPTGAWALVGCTVSPGFTFEGFELAPPDWAPAG